MSHPGSQSEEKHSESSSLRLVCHNTVTSVLIIPRNCQEEKTPSTATTFHGVYYHVLDIKYFMRQEL